MREVLTISIGQAGIQLGEAVWQQYCAEHYIDMSGKLQACGAAKDYIDTGDNSFLCFFEESTTGLYVPRNLMIDLESNVIDDILCSKYRKIFHPQFLLSGKQDAANNFARGYYSVGREMIDIINDKLRKLANCCDNIQGFLINRSIVGGTGSGLGSLMLESIAVGDYRKKEKISFEIYPSPTISTSIVTPYNALLATHFLLDLTQISIVLDNEAVYNICQRWLDIRRPSYANLNNLIRKQISSMTSTLRFEGELNVTLDEFRTNLVPFPRLHLMITSLAPVDPLRKCLGDNFRSDCRSITDLCFNSQYFFTKIADFDVEEDKYMAISLNYFGNVKAKEANATAYWLKANKKVTFVEWCPTGFKIGTNDTRIYRFPDDDIAPCLRMAAMIGNNTAISRVLSERISKKYDLMYSQRAFVHWYVCEGMEEGDFEEAREDLDFLEKDYLDVLCEECTTSEDSNSD